MFGTLLFALIINLIIPAIGYFVSNWILNDIGSKIEVEPLLACIFAEQQNISEMKSICDIVDNLSLLQNASIGVTVTCLGLIILYIITGLISESRRSFSSISFLIGSKIMHDAT